MSAVQIQGNAAGTGTLTIAAPNTNSNQTLTLPDNTGTLLSTASTFAGTGPAFSAYPTNALTVTSGAAQKIVLASTASPGFDTNSNFSTANSRFTPTVAGYYQINGCGYYTTSATITLAYIIIYKNNAAYKYGNGFTGTATVAFCTVSELIYFNGSTDYVELWAVISGTGTLTVNSGSSLTYFSGTLVKAA